MRPSLIVIACAAVDLGLAAAMVVIGQQTFGYVLLGSAAFAGALGFLLWRRGQ